MKDTEAAKSLCFVLRLNIFEFDLFMENNMSVTDVLV